MKLLLIIALLTYARGSAVPNLCKVGAASGDGNDAITRYYYNAAQDACVTFSYTGSGGNENNFPSEAECRRSCGLSPPNYCTVAADSGQGFDKITRYYYNPTQKACLTFFYKGKGGNGNNFPSEAECRRSCGLPPPNFCTLASDLGDGNDFLTRYYYNAAQDACLTFSYSGSGGNGNKFADEAECRKKCGLPPAHVCNHGIKSGTCTQSQKRFFNNIASKTCESFTYSGCGGNSNRFTTLKACQDTCMPKSAFCREDSDSGDGNDVITRYYHDMRTKTCLSFDFTGVGGNRNNFADETECRKKCGLPPLPDCQQSMDSGTCKATEKRFFYNTKTKKCESFIYGGCGGNDNRFMTLKACQKMCMPKSGACRNRMLSRKCKASKKWFFYNSASKKCQSFTCTACGGKGNKFRTLKACQKACILKSGK